MKFIPTQARQRMLSMAAGILMGIGTMSVHAEIVSEVGLYKNQEHQFKGQLVYDNVKKTKSAAILMGPTWTGPGEYTLSRAQQLALMGYVVLVADIYGEGQQPTRGKESAAAMNTYMKDRPLLRNRMQLAYKALSSNPRVDPKKIIALGYCFGGTGVLELARDGAPLAGVVVFHGILDTPHPEDAKNIKSPVIVFNGTDDPNSLADAVVAFEEEMRQAKVDLQFINYSGTKHAFTDPSSGSDTSKGAFYHPLSDARSWTGMVSFLSELKLTGQD